MSCFKHGHLLSRCQPLAGDQWRTSRLARMEQWQDSNKQHWYKNLPNKAHLTQAITRQASLTPGLYLGQPNAILSSGGDERATRGQADRMRKSVGTPP